METANENQWYHGILKFREPPHSDSQAQQAADSARGTPASSGTAPSLSRPREEVTSVKPGESVFYRTLLQFLTHLKTLWSGSQLFSQSINPRARSCPPLLSPAMGNAVTCCSLRA